VNVADNPPDTKVILAVDDSKNTLLEIVKVICIKYYIIVIIYFYFYKFNYIKYEWLTMWILKY